MKVSFSSVSRPLQTNRTELTLPLLLFQWTDSRSRLLQELLGSFAIIKYFTLERPFLERECSPEQGTLAFSVDV